MTDTTLRDAARTAFLYALPLTEIASVRDTFLDHGLPTNRFYPQRGLATSKDRFVTTPNVDTIYANAFIDLTQAPVALTLPAFGDRYASVSLMDMFSDNVAVLGTRTTGGDGGVFTLVGPTDAGPVEAIRFQTPWVWALARVVVAGPADAESALKILHGFSCEGAATAARPARGADRDGSWDIWLNAANALMMENAPPATDRRVLAGMAALGLGRPDFDTARFSADQIAEIEAGLANARMVTRFAGFGGKSAGGWLYPAANTGNFFQDYETRAKISVGGLAALPTAEALYLAAMPPDGPGLFVGDGPWKLHFAADKLPPVDAFWSLTMYQAEAGGGLFLTDNAIDRYAIGDRTPGLAYGEDGSLDIVTSRADPGEGQRTNWLPAPAAGPFTMILRTYLPHQELIAQTYTPPAVERV